jgi:hypothetical protein
MVISSHNPRTQRLRQEDYKFEPGLHSETVSMKKKNNSNNKTQYLFILKIQGLRVEHCLPCMRVLGQIPSTAE